MSESLVNVSLKQKQNYQFEVTFGGQVPPLLADEPAPMGAGLGPSPMQLLAAAVGNCLVDSLLFALRKFKQNPDPLRCDVEAQVGRNSEGRLRVLQIRAGLTLGVPAASLENLERILEQFESFCTVTQSVGQGIEVVIEVFDCNQLRLKPR
ncbi:MAG: OsmC family protein [Rhodoferax sp.]